MTHFGPISQIGRVFTESTRPTPPERVLYVRPGGSDSAAGTLSAPLASLLGALKRVPSIIDDAYYVIDVTGYGLTAPGAFHFPFKGSSLPVRTRVTDGAFVGDRLRAPLTVRAVPSLLRTLNVTAQATDGVTGLRTLTTTDTLTLNELNGRLVQNASLEATGVVVANTAGVNASVTVTAASGDLTGLANVQALTSTLSLGEVGDLFNLSATQGVGGALAFIGINLPKTNDSRAQAALYHNQLNETHYVFCRVQGLHARNVGPISLSHCFVYDGALLTRNTDLDVRQSVLREVSLRAQGAASNTNYSQCVFAGCSPAGHGGSENDAGGGEVTLTDCDITTPRVGGAVAGALTDGITFNTGRLRVTNTRIVGAVRGVVCTGPGIAVLDNVQGACTGVGVSLANGAHVERLNGTAITGTSGDVLLGAAGVVAWAAGEATDTSHLTRWF